MQKLDDAKAHYLELIEKLKKVQVENANLSICYFSLSKNELLRENYQESIIQA